MSETYTMRIYGITMNDVSNLKRFIHDEIGITDYDISEEED